MAARAACTCSGETIRTPTQGRLPNFACRMAPWTSDFSMKDTSSKIPNSARLGGSSGRIEKTVPLGAWYDPAVSPSSRQFCSSWPSYALHRLALSFVVVRRGIFTAGSSAVRHHCCWQPHVHIRLRPQDILSPRHRVRHPLPLRVRSRCRESLTLQPRVLLRNMQLVQVQVLSKPRRGGDELGQHCRII